MSSRDNEAGSARKSIRDRFELAGRNYVVTGGAMGIGYAIARDICEMGGNAAVLDSRETPLEDVYGLAKQFSVKSEYFQADVSDEQSLRIGFEKAVSALGSIDGIVTAAGIAIDKPFVKQGWEEVNKILQVNVSLFERGSPLFTADSPVNRAWVRSLLHNWQSSKYRNREHLVALL